MSDIAGFAVPGESDADRSTREAATVNAARWLQTRMGMDPASARFAASAVLAILYPYVLNLAHVHMADGLRAAGVTQVADVIDQVRHEQMTKPEEPHGTDPAHDGGPGR